MILKSVRLLSLMVVMFTMFSVSAFAVSSNYYSKVTVKAVGEGKVYANYNVTTSSPTFATESSATSGKQSSQNHKYYLYAQAEEGNVFVGWYNNEECTGTSISTDAVYQLTVNATSTNQSSPTTQAYYAKFQSASAPILNYSETRVFANLSTGTYKNQTLTAENVGEITYESSNENVATVAADGTVTFIKNGSCFIKAKAGEVETSYVLTVIDDIAAGVTQIGNGDFEDWRGVTSSNHAPNNWNSFETSEGSLASLSSGQQIQMVEDHRPGSNGFYCADIWSRSVLGVVAQGNLTTGCINAGATSASAKGNYNYSKTSDPKKSETLSKVPSAMKLWVKFVPAATNVQHPNAHVQAIVHGNGDYITYSSDSYDDDNNRNLVIAKAEYDFPSTKGEWKELTIPFVATGNISDGQTYILVNISTNADPGQGQSGDHMYIDDIELIYPDEPVVFDKYVSVGHDTPAAAPIEVTYNNDNTIDFSLKNFGLDLGGNYANVGNVNVPGLSIDNQGNFSFEGNIQITAGDKEGVEFWLGPTLGDIPLQLAGNIKGDYFYVHLDINMGAPIEVEVGDKKEATFKVGDALIGTFCAPFAVAIPQAYMEYVSTINGAMDNVILTLEPVEGSIIPAHTPVVVQIPMAMEMPVSGIYVKGTPKVGWLTGVYEDTKAPVGSYVLQNIDGKVGFYQVERNNQPTVKANRAYLTASAANVKAFFFNEDDATSINEALRMKNEEINEGAVYNLAGQRIGKMQKGINIVNGKKILK